MNSVETSSGEAAGTPPVKQGEMRLEVLVIPVSDLDRSKQFYEGLGWSVDAEFSDGEGYSLVQVTPPGSGCSVIFGTGVSSAAPGSYEGMHLAVYDIDAVREDLVGRGVDVSETFHDATGVFHHAGSEGRLSGPAPDHADYGTFASFSDPDGNTWVLQEIKTRLPGR